MNKVRSYTNESELINIAYNSLKVKFDNMKLFENYSIDANTKKIRVLFLDLTFIYNFLFGFFINNKNPELIFNDGYLKLHTIEILNLISHYRRFFYYKLKTDIDYIFIYRTPNLKQQRSIYQNIFKSLDDLSKFIPNFYVNEGLNRIKIYFHEIFQQEFYTKYRSTDDFKMYLVTTDETLKGCLYSFANQYFTRDNLLLNAFYKNNKVDLVKMEDEIPAYHDLFYNKDRLFLKKFKENYYKIVLLESISPSFHRIRKTTKAKKLLKIFNEDLINLDSLMKDEEKQRYFNILSQIQSTDVRFKNLVSTILRVDDVKLYDHELYAINNDMGEFKVNIEWLLRLN